MLFSKKELNTCSVVTANRYYALWLKTGLAEYYDIFQKCCRFDF